MYRQNVVNPVIMGILWVPDQNIEGDAAVLRVGLDLGIEDT